VALDVDATSVSGVWWRHIPHRGKVWYQPPHPGDGRWQHGSIVEAMYFADSPDTAWAEWYRFLAEFALRPTLQMPRHLWRWQINLSTVADLSTQARLKRIGVPISPLGRSSWLPYQLTGETLHAKGWPALIAPSAARPGAGQVLCVFRTSNKVPGLTPLPPPQVWRHPPAPPTGMRT
jgi:RES domain-containing protein